MQSLPFQLLLVVITLASVLVQAVRVHRHGAAGVSAATWLGLVASVSLWCAYGIVLGDLALIATNAPGFLVALVIVVTLVRAGATSYRLLALVVVATGVWIGGALLIGRPGAMGAAASAMLVGRILPQLVVAVREADVTGVSIVTWVSNAITKLPWALYGLAIGDVWVGGSAAVGVVLSLVIVAVVGAKRPELGQTAEVRDVASVTTTSVPDRSTVT